MRLYTAKPSDAEKIAQFLTIATGKRWDEMTIQNDISDKTQYFVRQDDQLVAVFSIKPLAQGCKLIYRLIVKERLRGKGIGSAILRVSKKRCEQTGNTLYAECPQRDDRLVHFLTKNGFTQMTSYTDRENIVGVFRG